MATRQTQPTRAQQVRILLVRAMTQPMAIAIILITAGVAFAVSPWFVGVGVLFYAFIVYSSLQDPTESRRVLNETLYPERARKFDLNKLTGSYRNSMQRAIDTRQRIEAAVSDTSEPSIRKALFDSTNDLNELVGTIYDIALKAQSLLTSLQSSKVNVSALSEDVRRLERIVETTGDEFARDQYRATLEGKREQLKNFTDIKNALDRWHAQLDNALSTLDTILSQVLRIKSSEVLSLSSTTDEVSNTLKEEVEALKATSDALDEVYGLSN
jgi:archaellum component FlaC